MIWQRCDRNGPEGVCPRLARDAVVPYNAIDQTSLWVVHQMVIEVVGRHSGGLFFCLGNISNYCTNISLNGMQPLFASKYQTALKSPLS